MVGRQKNIIIQHHKKKKLPLAFQWNLAVWDHTIGMKLQKVKVRIPQQAYTLLSIPNALKK